MRQLGLSADVYCQKLNNQSYAEMSFILEQKEGETGQAPERHRERECVRDEEWLKIELASVVKTVVGE